MMNPILKRTLCGLGVGALVIGLFLYCPLRALMPIILILSTSFQRVCSYCVSRNRRIYNTRWEFYMECSL